MIMTANAPAIRGVQIPFANREEWLQIRRTGLGSTDAAAALGISRYKTPRELWLEKTGQTEEFTANARTERGTDLEPLIADHYQKQNNVEVHAVNTLYRHLLFPQLVASIDRLVFDPKRGWGLVECKSTDSYVYESWNKGWTTERLPNGLLADEYYVQGMAQLMVTGLDWVDVHILIVDEWVYRTFTITRDDAAIHAMEVELAEWWHVHVEGNVEPERTAGEWKRTGTDGTEYTAGDADTDKLRSLFELKAQYNALKKTIDAREDEIALILRDADIITYGGKPIATYKSQTRENVSVSAVREAFGEQAESIITTSTFRVLREKKK